MQGLQLTDIIDCLQGVVPSPFATCGADGMPNVAYMSIVRYVDVDRVAVARQFVGKTAANVTENPAAQALVMDPGTLAEYTLDLEYLRTETAGSLFDALGANLAALGVEDVGALQGADVYRVVACVPVRPVDGASPRSHDPLRALDEFVERVAEGADREAAIRIALESLRDLFGIDGAVLLLLDGDRLRPIAANGCSPPPLGGLISTAARRRQVVTVPSVQRGRVMATRLRDRGPKPRLRAVPLPASRAVHSIAAVPLPAPGGIAGVLYLESAQPGFFAAHRERLLRIIAGHVAATLSRPALATADGAPLEVTYYQADDSVFSDGEYVIKGVPGRILWKLLREHAAGGRVDFTNRELRLDESLELPPGNDNLDSRLVSLRRRLAAGDSGIGLERVGRGQLQLRVDRPLVLSEVETQGPMQRARSWPAA